MLISVIIPAYNAQKSLSSLLDSLTVQSYRGFEIIIVDDCSTDHTSVVAQRYDFQLINLEKNRGPAFCRNIGSGKANGEILAFTDSDCRADLDWLENIHRHFINDEADALIGKVILNPSNSLGDSISALGFPAGGSVGFDKIWRVDGNGFTNSLSSCNCAIKKDAFESAGGFDETFPYAGGEDSYLAYSLMQSGHTIKYCPDVIMYHEARDSLKDFLKWQFRRGVSSYIFSQKVKEKKDFFRLRYWSTKNVIKNGLNDKKMPLILMLLFIGLAMQTAGAFCGKYMDVR
ncbi:MAG: glycosyltransferase [Deltaproteobacteria bacterium]|nr:glycosyltransferase [Deltaproteobacteria bacterium]